MSECSPKRQAHKAGLTILSGQNNCSTTPLALSPPSLLDEAPALQMANSAIIPKGYPLAASPFNLPESTELRECTRNINLKHNNDHQLKRLVGGVPRASIVGISLLDVVGDRAVCCGMSTQVLVVITLDTLDHQHKRPPTNHTFSAKAKIGGSKLCSSILH